MKKMNLTEATILALEGKLQEAPNVEGQMSFDDIEQAKDVGDEVVYVTNFNLEAPVNDYDAAVEYLTDDDMTQYLNDDWDFKDDIVKVEWDLQDESSGEIIVTAKRELTDEELEKVSNWIAGQNSDGLGEGFEQQDFAETYFNPLNGDGPFTRTEAEEEIDGLIQDIPVEDLISDGVLDIDEEVQEYMDDNGIDDYDEAYDAVRDDPDSYVDYDKIEDARYEYAAGSDYNIDDWYVMSSFDWKYNKYKLKRVN